MRQNSALQATHCMHPELSDWSFIELRVFLSQFELLMFFPQLSELKKSITVLEDSTLLDSGRLGVIKL